MRLYLSSFRVGDHPDRLLAMRRTDRPVAVIANSCDGAPPDVRAESVERELDAMRGLGLTAEELDLREYFGKQAALSDRLATHEIAWLRGGNVFALRHALAASGGDEVFVELLARDEIVYAGYSAGPCVLAPSLRGLELCDPVDDVRSLYGAEPIWEGLGVLDVAFVPHICSPGHPETELVAEVAARYRRDGVPHVTLRDGQVLVIDGESRELL
jgi:dipeptidase E